MKKNFTQLITSFLLLFLVTAVSAQSVEEIQKWMKQDSHFSDLNESDLNHLEITDKLTDKAMGITWIYLQQTLHDIPVYQTVSPVITKDGLFYNAGHSFAHGLDHESTYIQPSVTPSQAAYSIAKSIGFSLTSGVRELKNTASEIQLEAPDMRDATIKGKLVYVIVDGTPTLSYLLEMYPNAVPDMFSAAVDASTGEYISHVNYTTHADHGHLHTLGYEHDCETEAHTHDYTYSQSSSSGVDGAQYNVFGMPSESPNFGARTLEVSPADPNAAPFGWHDLDGAEGAEFTTTEGNFALAFLDRDGNGQPDGPLPDGGEDLIFDFPFDPNEEPQNQTEQAVVNAFYTTNVLHDFAWRYGFDDEVGFRDNNYSNDIRENDRVIVRVQANADNGSTNNANFSTPPDGNNGIMNIFVGENGSGGSVRIDEPVQISGPVVVGLADFGPRITTDAISGKVVPAFDDSGNPSFACDEVINGNEVSGNIALVDRGSCFFQQKVLNGQDAGAIAVIICNFEPSVGGMAQGDMLANPTIPSVMLGSNDCIRIRQVLDEGGEVSMTFQIEDASGPTLLDIALDNGVTAHEYGHGLSIRSTGGPQNSGCLSNDEQMGEGWSDYFSLVTSVLPGQDGTEARGIGTYAFGQEGNGPGIRRFPYSTDLNVNPQDYDDIIGTTAPHPLGEVWADILWDMYWLFVDRYGWDADFINGNGGNNQAIQLVFDGMRTQTCSPGFIQGREAILVADQVRFDGANQDIIWQAFARRGVGYSAEGGSVNNRNDGRAAFDLPPFLLNELIMVKSVTPTAAAGDDIEVTVTIRNQKEDAVTTVAFSEVVPDGLTFVGSSGDVEVTQSGNELVAELGAINPEQEVVLRYTYTTDETKPSVTYFFDDHEDRSVSRENWDSEALYEGDFLFERVDENAAFSGDFYWEAIPDPFAAANDNTDVTLYNLKPFNLSGLDNPVLKLTHFYNTRLAQDGGFVQVKPTADISWSRVEDDIFRGGYRGEIGYQTFTLPKLIAFWGSNDLNDDDIDDYVSSYIDLEDVAGLSEVDIRFRFGASEGAGADDSEWRVDDVEIIDMVNYNPVSVLTSAEGDMLEAVAPERGTIIDSDIATATVEIGDDVFSFEVFPSPADDIVNLQFESTVAETAQLTITGVDGKMIQSQEVRLIPGRLVTPLSVTELASGLYFATLEIGNERVTERFVKK